MVGDRGAVRRSENMGFEAIGNVRWRMKQPVGRGHLTTPKPRRITHCKSCAELFPTCRGRRPRRPGRA